MQTRIIPSLFIAMTLALSHSAPHAAERVHVEVNEPDSLTTAKPLRMSVQETHRDERTSTILVQYESGASVASSMLIMKAVWQIARARGDRYAMMLTETTVFGGRENVIGFAQQRRDDYLQYFDINNREGRRSALEWVDMNQFDALWRLP